MEYWIEILERSQDSNKVDHLIDVAMLKSKCLLSQMFNLNMNELFRNGTTRQMINI